MLRWTDLAAYSRFVNALAQGEAIVCVCVCVAMRRRKRECVRVCSEEREGVGGKLQPQVENDSMLGGRWLLVAAIHGSLRKGTPAKLMVSSIGNEQFQLELLCT